MLEITTHVAMKVATKGRVGSHVSVQIEITLLWHKPKTVETEVCALLILNCRI